MDVGQVSNIDLGEVSVVNPELARDVVNVLAQYTQSVEISSVAKWVNDCMAKALTVRQPYTHKLEKATYAVRQEYTPEETRLIIESQQVDIHMGIVATKIATVSAWLKDVYSGDAKVWTLGTSPIPELPEAVNNAIMERVISEVVQNGVPVEQVPQMLQAFQGMAESYAVTAAETGATAMERYIDDRLKESGFSTELAQFIDDYATYPYAVMGGPFVINKRAIGWHDNQVIETMKPTLAARRINPVNFYWSADAVDCQTCEYVIEYSDMSSAALYDARELNGFIQSGIDRILATDYNFGQCVYASESLNNLQRKTYETLGAHTRYPVIKYFGRVPAAYLSQHGIDVYDPIKPVEVEVWVVGDIVIRLVEDPYPCGRRPFYMTSYNKVPGGMVGKGLHDILSGVERVANAAARNIVKNMSYAAGPIAEIDENRIADTDRGLTTVKPFYVYRVHSDIMNPGAPAIRFMTIPSVAAELNGVFEKFSSEADRISGLHPLLLGQVDVASSSRTASGLSMILSNASKVIKAMLGNIDRDVIIPLIHGFYEWVMMYDTTFTQKVDAVPVAKGSGHALQRDMQQAKVLELLGVLQPYAVGGMIPPGTIIMLLRELVTGAGFDANVMLPSVDASMMQVQNAMMGQSGSTPEKAPPPNVPQGLLNSSDGRFVQSPV